MTNPNVPACEAETGNGDQRALCGNPASYETADGPRCTDHGRETDRRVPRSDWAPTGPGLHGDNLAGHQAARQAIESALTTMPTGTRTVEAKAGHIHAQLVAKGWHLAKPDPGHDLVQVGADEQVVTVPDGHAIEVVPTTPTYSYADSELDALAGIVTQLEALDPDVRERVTAYLTDRYGPTAPGATPWAALSGWNPGGAVRHVPSGGPTGRRRLLVTGQGDEIVVGGGHA